MVEMAADAVGGDVAIVLVHGAFHGPWCWDGVVGPLEGLGWRVRTVTLPLRSLRGDADVVRAVVRSAAASGASVLLVGHSYGGVVVSAGGHEADELVYVAAGMPDAGECAAAAADRMGVPELITSDDGLWVSVAPCDAPGIFYQDCAAEVIAKSVPRLRALAISTQNESISDPAWTRVRSSYVLCRRDKALAPSYQLERAQRLGEYVEIDCGHSPFFSAIPRLVGRLDELALRLRNTQKIGARKSHRERTPS